MERVCSRLVFQCALRQKSTWGKVRHYWSLFFLGPKPPQDVCTLLHSLDLCPCAFYRNLSFTKSKWEVEMQQGFWVQMNSDPGEVHCVCLVIGSQSNWLHIDPMCIWPCGLLMRPSRLQVGPMWCNNCVELLDFQLMTGFFSSEGDEKLTSVCECVSDKTRARQSDCGNHTLAGETESSETWRRFNHHSQSKENNQVSS